MNQIRKINHGIDLVDLKRDEWKNLDFVIRYMSKKEYDGYLKQTTDLSRLMYASGIWCLKEAVIKATCKKYNFYEIEVDLDFNQPVSCNIENISLSISYESDLVIGSAIYYL